MTDPMTAREMIEGLMNERHELMNKNAVLEKEVNVWRAIAYTFADGYYVDALGTTRIERDKLDVAFKAFHSALREGSATVDVA